MRLPRRRLAKGDDRAYREGGNNVRESVSACSQKTKTGPSRAPVHGSVRTVEAEQGTLGCLLAHIEDIGLSSGELRISKELHTQLEPRPRVRRGSLPPSKQESEQIRPLARIAAEGAHLRRRWAKDLVERERLVVALVLSAERDARVA